MLPASVHMFFSRVTRENIVRRVCRNRDPSNCSPTSVRHAAFPNSLQSDPHLFVVPTQTLRHSLENVGCLVIMAAVAFLVSSGTAQAAGGFERAELRLEQNLLDKDVEVKFDIVTKQGGVAALQVTAPDGRVVIDFKSPGSKFGMRHLELESPEPANDGRIQADFPEGVYRFVGTTNRGSKLEATKTLSHRLPPAPQMISPQPEQKDVPLVGTKVRWKPMPGIAQYVVILENEQSGREITAILSGTTNAFSVPTGFLIAGADYKVEIGAVGKNGNRTFVEYEVTTAREK